MADVASIVIPIVVVLLLLYILYKGVQVVREKEAVVVERMGSFSRVLTPGVHFVMPFVEYPKEYNYRFVLDTPDGGSTIVEKSGNTRISLQNEVLDFPKQNVITRDNASISLDAIMSYQINNPTKMIYSVTNLPNVLSKLLQAHIRNVAATLDVDQIIEDAGLLNVLTQLLNDDASKWGVAIIFVKIQKVEAYSLTEVLSKKKNADLQNKEIIISAKSAKQTNILNAEGQRDSMIKKAEGDSQNMIAKARGEAEAIVNNARAEAKSIDEIAPSIHKLGENPSKYLICRKYLGVLNEVARAPGTQVRFIPQSSIKAQTLEGLGLHAVMSK